MAWGVSKRAGCARQYERMRAHTSDVRGLMGQCEHRRMVQAQALPECTRNEVLCANHSVNLGLVRCSTQDHVILASSTHNKSILVRCDLVQCSHARWAYGILPRVLIPGSLGIPLLLGITGSLGSRSRLHQSNDGCLAVQTKLPPGVNQSCTLVLLEK